MVVMGIDPGSKYTGYGLVAQNGSNFKMVAAGRIATTQRASLAFRLHQVYEGLERVILEFSPTSVSIEDIFFAKNVRSAVRLGHVRGVAMLAAAAAGLEVHEYPPASIKMAVVGYGRADKAQVGLMVKNILGLHEALSEDACDALAAAICHLNQNPLLKGTAK